MKKSTDTTLTINADYRQFVETMKARVFGARTSAARAVTHDAILLYWDNGRGIVEKQNAHGWGDSVVEMVAADLRRAFPEMSGWSPANVWRMRQLHLVYSSDEFLAQVARGTEKRPASEGLAALLAHGAPQKLAVRQKDDIEGEYALRSKANRIGVAAYELHSKLPGELKGKLPTAKQLADIVRVAMESE
jgi:hypothetical protein